MFRSNTRRQILTRSQRDVQTPLGMQSSEYMFNLNYDEVQLLNSINILFSNIHWVDDDRLNQMVFGLTDRIIVKIIKGELPFKLEEYYDGQLEDTSDHANRDELLRLIEDVGNHLFKKMHDPQAIKFEERKARKDNCSDFLGVSDD